MRWVTVFSAGVVLSCAMLTAGGCSRPQAVEPETVAAPAPAAAPIEAMTPEQKRSAIATSFPIEVPVPNGEFTRAQAQGADAWDYTVLVGSTPDAVVDWYREAYGSRGWELVGQRESGGTDAGHRGVTLTFLKGGSQSEVAVDSVADANGATTARVILGVGVPVLQTQ